MEIKLTSKVLTIELTQILFIHMVIEKIFGNH